MPEAQTPQFVHYLPLVTTVLSVAFLVALSRHYLRRRSGPHLLWWAAGIFTYGLGTGLESAITLFGNTAALTKAWYIAGAFLGGYPLAQGTVYLLLERKRAHLLTAITVPIIVIASIFVVFSPVNFAALEAHRPSGAVLAWSWLRLVTPFINLYAVFFLVGGAILSAVRYAKMHSARKRGAQDANQRVESTGDGQRALGNASIAFGAILPGIGGTMAKAGVVEGLYVGELVGLVFIWAGYVLCARAGSPAPVAAEAQDEPADLAPSTA